MTTGNHASPDEGRHGEDVGFDRVVRFEGEPLLGLRQGSGTALAVALHAGHHVRPEIKSLLAVHEADRLREEDPYTALLAPGGVPLVASLRSRFEFDLNRPRQTAVYLTPSDAWGLQLWDVPPDDSQIAVSLNAYDVSYETLREAIEARLGRSETALVLDLHSYNHRRGGPQALPDDPDANPEVNLGTKRINRTRWEPVTAAFVDSLSSAGFDVRENVKFGGGHFAQWVSEHFDDRVCVLSIEFKKTFMDEWTGYADIAQVERYRDALESALPRLLAAVDSVT